MDLIKGGQTGLNDIKNYWIGGLTYSDPGDVIQFSEYYSIESGSYIICSNKHLLNSIVNSETHTKYIIGTIKKSILSYFLCYFSWLYIIQLPIYLAIV